MQNTSEKRKQMSTEYEAKLVYGRRFKTIDEAVDFLQGEQSITDQEVIDAFTDGEIRLDDGWVSPITWNPEHDGGGVLGWHITKAELDYSLNNVDILAQRVNDTLSEEGSWGDDISYHFVIYSY